MIFRAELPTPDVVIVRHAGGKVTVVAHPAVPDSTVAIAAAAELDDLDGGTDLTP